MPAPLYPQKKKNPLCNHRVKNMTQLWTEYTPNGKGCYLCKICNEKFIINHKNSYPTELFR